MQMRKLSHGSESPRPEMPWVMHGEASQKAAKLGLSFKSLRWSMSTFWDSKVQGRHMYVPCNTDIQYCLLSQWKQVRVWKINLVQDV
jgi:hypothetical protein